ncbi:unnamed protein product [marine sediment metagenome]|uniref:ANTAR domain-containing protein n=1 Tax=marine sediment metagenome TaxID=412755 RepID=X1CE62_9ZZZZ
MKNLKEDDGVHQVSHKILSTNKLLSTHSSAIKELLNQISKSYHISINDAAFAVENALKRFEQIK